MLGPFGQLKTIGRLADCGDGGGRSRSIVMIDATGKRGDPNPRYSHFPVSSSSPLPHPFPPPPPPPSPNPSHPRVSDIHGIRGGTTSGWDDDHDRSRIHDPSASSHLSRSLRYFRRATGDVYHSCCSRCEKRVRRKKQKQQQQQQQQRAAATGSRRRREYVMETINGNRDVVPPSSQTPPRNTNGHGNRDGDVGSTTAMTQDNDCCPSHPYSGFGTQSFLRRCPPHGIRIRHCPVASASDSDATFPSLSSLVAASVSECNMITSTFCRRVSSLAPMLRRVYRSTLPILWVVIMWIGSTAAYQWMQYVHRTYCSPNLIQAILFAQSDACTHLSFAIDSTERAWSRVLHAVVVASLYGVYRRVTHGTDPDHHRNETLDVLASIPTIQLGEMHSLLGDVHGNGGRLVSKRQ